jgi:membrane associated rhomboid family serine protease
MVLMLVFAPFVENKIGSKNFLFTYLFVGFFGYLSVNYSYYVNQNNITNSIQNVGLDIEDIKIDNGVVSDDYLLSLNEKQSNVVSNYNYVISKTYGASSALYGMFILYLLFNVFNIKKVIFNLTALYFIGYTLFVVFNHQPILNGGEFAHFGGIVGGVIAFLLYKTKKGIV